MFELREQRLPAVSVLTPESPPILSFRMNAVNVEEWSLDLIGLGRIVLHCVLNTALEADERVKLYVDGADVGSMNMPPAQGDVIALSTGRYVIGNRTADDGSIGGWIYYCALYTVALDADEVAQNAAILARDDDTP